MKEIVKKNKAFLIPWLLFLLTGGVLFACFSKAELHLFLNSYHSKPLDVIFYYITWLGDFVTAVTLSLLLLFIRYRYAVMMVAGNLLAAGVTQLLKHTLFSDAVRPVQYFKGTNQLKLVDGVQNWLYNSFPSGHTTSAFATFFCLALISKEPLNKLIFFFIALSVGFSRVYLSQHFFDDIYAGSIVGVVCMAIAYAAIRPSERAWMDKAIFRNGK